MNYNGKTIIITGAGSGIGAVLARRFSAEGANVAVADINADAGQSVARNCNAHAVPCDVTDEAQIQNLVSETEKVLGPVDMFVSNAGIAHGEPDHATSAPTEVWQRLWAVHVLAHLYAARAVLPGMLERRQGTLVNMASAAGLLSQIGDAAYTATKHAAVAFAESLAITHGDDGIDVRVICPQYVATPLTGYADGEPAGNETTISAEQAADAILTGLAGDSFLIHTHPDTHQFAQLRAADPDAWLAGMRKLRSKIISETGSTRLEDMHKWI